MMSKKQTVEREVNSTSMLINKIFIFNLNAVKEINTFTQHHAGKDKTKHVK